MKDLVERLLAAIKEQRSSVVAVIGDVIVDRWVHGRVETCQDDCPKFVPAEVAETPGGAANAERCLSHWRPCGLRTHLYGQPLNNCPIKTRYVEAGRIVFRADNDGPRPRGMGLQWVRDLALEMVKCAGGVLLSDYDKGLLTPDFIREVVAVCRQCGIPCVADAKREPETYAGCVIKGNEEYWARYRSHVPAFPSDACVVTLGANDPLTHPLGTKASTSLPPVKCRNHVGAGDCFAAHLTLALTYGFSLKEAAALAHSAGRVYVQHPHNRPPTPQEVAADLSLAT